MDKIEKALEKLSPTEKKQIRGILQQILANDFKGLDLKKLKSREDIFRVRKGNFRIIYRLFGSSTFILAIERRSEKTYKRFK